MTAELARFGLGAEADVFTVRHWAREIAAELGFEEQDQVRLATAVSEVGREVVGAGAGGGAVFGLDGKDRVLEIAFTSRRPLPGQAAGSSGLGGAARLVDVLEIAPSGSGTAVRLRKDLAASEARTDFDVEVFRGRLARARPVSALDELRDQNARLLAALDEVTARQAELVRLNEEISETNHGVMAMYAQLSDELDETNRGVVALYAELDKRTVEVQEASEAKSRFLRSVSHELRAPLTSMVALTGLLAEPDGDPLTAEQQHQVTLVASAARELLGLVNELLDLARAESGRLAPEVAPVELRPLFGELRGAFRPLAPAGVTLEVTEPVDVPSVETDRSLLAQVLRNLLSNAVKFTERGRVALAARPAASGQHVELSVTDTGIGIAPDDQDKVFEEFFQVRGPRQALQRGSGLGLPYVRRVVEALGGTVGLESEPGVGTRVTVVLPRRWLAGHATAAAAPPSHGRTGVKVGTVLVVDDDPTFRQVLRGMLQGVADRVVEAADGAEALAAAAALRPDVVFLDLRMPVLDGGDVLSEMAVDPALWSVPVVVVTSADLRGVVPAAIGHARASLSKADLSDERVAELLATVVPAGAS